MRPATRTKLNGSSLPPGANPYTFKRPNLEKALERLTHYEAGVLVGSLLREGYGLTVRDVCNATGLGRLAAFRILTAACRILNVQSVPLYEATATPPPDHRPPLVWFLEASPCGKGSIQ